MLTLGAELFIDPLLNLFSAPNYIVAAEIYLFGEFTRRYHDVE